jgi:hypothetical protein
VRKLLTLLVRREHVPNTTDRWWKVVESTGENPSTERQYLFTYPQVLAYLRSKLNKTWGNDA